MVNNRIISGGEDRKYKVRVRTLLLIVMNSRKRTAEARVVCNEILSYGCEKLCLAAVSTSIAQCGFIIPETKVFVSFCIHTVSVLLQANVFDTSV